MEASVKTFCGAVVFGMGFALGAGLIVVILQLLSGAASQGVKFLH